MRSLHALRPLAGCLVAYIAATAASAATITVTANDASGNPVANTVLILQDASRTTVAQQSTDARGTATFQNVPAGRYVVRTQSAAPVEASTDVAKLPPLRWHWSAGQPGGVSRSPPPATRGPDRLSPKVGTTVYTPTDLSRVRRWSRYADE